MRAFLVLLAALLIGFVGYAVRSFTPPALLEAASDEFALTDVRLIEPMLGKTDSANITIAGGKIARIEEMGSADDPDSPYRDHYVLPGFINAHVHLPNKTPLHLSEFVGLLYLRHGVTTVRVAGDPDGTSVPAARNAYEREGYPGPRINSCGSFVGGAGTTRWPNTIETGSPDSAINAVRQLKEDGAQCIKAYDGLDVATIRALISAARSEDLPVIGHVPFALTLEQSLVPNVQHLMGTANPDDIAGGNSLLQRFIDWQQVDEERIDKVVRISVENGLVHTPTLSTILNFLNFEDQEQALQGPAARLMPRLFSGAAWHPQTGVVMYRNIGPREFDMMRDALPKKLALVGKLHEARVPLMLGTDDLQPFATPGLSFWKEMRLFSDAGIPLPEVWAYSTRQAAGDFDVPWLGYIREGAPADLLIFEKDPTQDLDNLNTLSAVVRDGKLYPVEELDRAIEAYQDYYKRPLVDLISVQMTKRIVAKSPSIE